MAIPFSISPYISNFAPYQPPISATPSLLCKPPQEGLKYLPMQFMFQQAFAWRVDLGLGAPNPALSQCCSMYVDCLLSNHQIAIYFPDSGFTQLVNRACTAYFPVLTGLPNPVFFVSIIPWIAHAPYPSDLVNTQQDIVNLFVLNQYIPGLFNPNNINATTNNPGAFYGETFDFTMGQIFDSATAIAGGATSSVAVLINNNKWFFNSVDINICGATTDGSTNEFTITLFDGATKIMVKDFILNGTLQSVQLFSRDNLNYVSLGNGALTAVIANSVGGLMALTAKLSANIFGDILVS